MVKRKKKENTGKRKRINSKKVGVLSLVVIIMKKIKSAIRFQIMNKAVYISL